jgi:hypothetical protein
MPLRHIFVMLAVRIFFPASPFWLYFRFGPTAFRPSDEPLLTKME